MFRTAMLALVCVILPCPNGFGQPVAPAWHMEYTPSHRASFEQTWTYSFPNHQSTHWIIALRYPPELAWSKEVEGKAELLTSQGWKPFAERREGSKEQRRLLTIDYPHDDLKLRHGFTIRTTLTATICAQRLAPGKPAQPVAPLGAEEKEAYLAATDTFDFHKPEVKKWLDAHKMWQGKNEQRLAFVQRVYKELRLSLPYSTADGGPWVCSQILKVGFGECCRHAIVGTAILRANHIPARTVCGLWAIDAKSQGAHCWGEFFLEGVGWVPSDTSIDSEHPNSDAYFGKKAGEVLAGMVDFDWVIQAGPFGKQTVFAVDAFPALWSEGKGAMDNDKVDTTTRVRILKRFR